MEQAQVMDRPDRSPHAGWPVRTRAGIALFALLVTLLASLRYSPQVYWQGRDDGIYAYDGMVIHAGGVPYRDTWQNKPPGALYAIALGYALFGVGRWAIWGIELIFVALAGLVMAGLLAAVFRRLSVVLAGTAAFILLARHPDLAADSNFTETYALLPQAIVFALGYRFLRRPSSGLAALIGLSAAAVFLFKVTAVGMALVLIPALILARHPVVTAPGRWRWLGAAIAGGLAGLGAAALYFAAHGALGAAYDAIIVAPGAFHNWLSGGPPTLGEMLYRTFILSTVPAVMGPLAVFWGVGAVQTLRGKVAPDAPPDHAASTRALALWALLTFAADLLLTNLTARGYRHYYITPVPPLAILVAFGVSFVRVARWPRRRPHLLARAAWVYLLALLLFRPAQDTLRKWSWADWDLARPVREDRISVYIRQHTAPDDRVLVWGASSDYNFQARRFSPTQFHYSYPLLVPGYTTGAQIADFLDDLRRERPALVVDAAWSDGDVVPPITPERRAVWLANPWQRGIPDLSGLFAFVEAHCALETTIDRVYLYRCHYD